MLLCGIRCRAPGDRGPVPCVAQVTLNSARRCPLRQTGFCVRRGLSPRREPVLYHMSSGPLRGVFHKEDHMITTMFWAMALLAMSCAIGSVNKRQHFATVSLHRGRR